MGTRGDEAGGAGGRSALEAELAALRARVEVLEAFQAIQNLKARYGSLADRRYTRKGPRSEPEIAAAADALVELFTEDAVWDGGATLGVAEGHDAIRARFVAPTLEFSWHYFVKPEIHVDGDEASGTWDILAPCTLQDGTAMWMSGVEHDRYRRVDGVWLHSHMRLEPVFMVPHATGWGRPKGDGS